MYKKTIILYGARQVKSWFWGFDMRDAEKRKDVRLGGQYEKTMVMYADDSYGCSGVGRLRNIRG